MSVRIFFLPAVARLKGNLGVISKGLDNYIIQDCCLINLKKEKELELKLKFVVSF